jgi:GNAT superfamily N-acetyltransferase
MVPIEIITAKTPAEIRQFIELPWKIYEGYENWVPPLKSEVRRLLDVRRHPYWEFAERTLFLARRGSRIVGRIAGIIDHNFNQYHDEKSGAWGFFECRNDDEAAGALFEAVENRLAHKGMNLVRGPLSPSMNYEMGLLIEGFEYQPAVMMSYNPPYYRDLVESHGFEKERDLFAFHVTAQNQVSERMERLAGRIMKRGNLTIRPFDGKDLRGRIRLFKELYNEYCSEHWAFVPFSDGEADELLRQFRRIGDPDLIFFVYHGNEPIAAALILPDLNPLLKRLNGRLGLIGLIKVLLHRSKIKGLRGMAFGVRKQYRGTGVPLVAYDYLARTAKSKGYQYLEMGWNVEENRSMMQLQREGGARAYKRYRVYCKKL